MSRVTQSFMLATRTLHIYLSLLGLALLMFFAVTGFMLLHKEWFGVDNAQDRPGPTAALSGDMVAAQDKQRLENYLRQQFAIRGQVREFDFDEPEFLVQFDRPGQRTTVKIPRQAPDAARDAGPAAYDVHISYEIKGAAGILADLHTGKSIGPAWRFCLDTAAILLMAASLTGLLIWVGLPRRRVEAGIELGARAGGESGTSLGQTIAPVGATSNTIPLAASATLSSPSLLPCSSGSA